MVAMLKYKKSFNMAVWGTLILRQFKYQIVRLCKDRCRLKAEAAPFEGSHRSLVAVVTAAMVLPAVFRLQRVTTVLNST